MSPLQRSPSSGTLLRIQTHSTSPSSSSNRLRRSKSSNTVSQTPRVAYSCLTDSDSPSNSSTSSPQCSSAYHYTPAPVAGHDLLMLSEMPQSALAEELCRMSPSPKREESCAEEISHSSSLSHATGSASDGSSHKTSSSAAGAQPQLPPASQSTSATCGLAQLPPTSQSASPRLPPLPPHIVCPGTGIASLVCDVQETSYTDSDYYSSDYHSDSDGAPCHDGSPYSDGTPRSYVSYPSSPEYPLSGDEDDCADISDDALWGRYYLELTAAAPSSPISPMSPLPSYCVNTHAKRRTRASDSPRIQLPAQQCDLSTQQCDLLAQQCDLLAQQCNFSAQPCDLSTQQCDLLAQQCDLPAQQCDLPAQQCDLPAQQCDLPTQQCDLSSSRRGTEGAISPMSPLPSCCVNTRAKRRTRALDSLCIQLTTRQHHVFPCPSRRGTEGAISPMSPLPSHCVNTRAKRRARRSSSPHVQLDKPFPQRGQHVSSMWAGEIDGTISPLSPLTPTPRYTSTYACHHQSTSSFGCGSPYATCFVSSPAAAAASSTTASPTPTPTLTPRRRLPLRHMIVSLPAAATSPTPRQRLPLRHMIVSSPVAASSPTPRRRLPLRLMKAVDESFAEDDIVEEELCAQNTILLHAHESSPSRRGAHMRSTSNPDELKLVALRDEKNVLRPATTKKSRTVSF